MIVRTNQQTSLPAATSLNVSIGGHAVQNWCLLRLLPLMVGDRIKDPCGKKVCKSFCSRGRLLSSSVHRSLQRVITIICANIHLSSFTSAHLFAYGHSDFRASIHFLNSVPENCTILRICSKI